MKGMSSLVIALIAIFSVLQAAHASLYASKVEMIANSSQPSIASADFHSTLNIDEGGNHGQIALFLPLLSDKYQKMDCTTAISVGNSQRFRFKRAVVSHDYSTSNFIRVNNDMDFDFNEYLGKAQTVCTFIAPSNFIGPNSEMHASIAVGSRSDIITDNTATIYPKNSVVTSVGAYISPTFSMDKPTAFKIQGINKPYTPGNSFIFRNPAASSATTGSTMKFSTTSNSILCDVYWDGVLYTKSVEASIIENGNGINFVLGSPMNVATELILYCYDLRGVTKASGYSPTAAPYLPTSIEFVYDGQYKEYTIAVTPSHPSTVSFETGFTEISNLPYF